MKVIIAGSRGIDDYEELKRIVVDSGFEISIVLSGNANGVDKLGERYAREHNVLGLWTFPADWGKYGRRAGHHRNKHMAEHADALIALWDGSSPGTKDMIAIAKKKRLDYYVKNLSNQEVTSFIYNSPLDV